MPPRKVFGTISRYDNKSNTYTVALEGGLGRIQQPGGGYVPGVGRKIQDPSDKSVLPNDTPVVIDFDLGIPVIDGVLPKNANKAILESLPDTSPNVGVDTGLEGETTNYAGGYYRQPDDPKNLFSGDWCRASSDGNFIAVLRGKLTKIFGGTRAQVIVSGLHGLVRTVCDNYEHFSSFGNLKIYNKNGRCNLKFEGAADQLNESGGQEQNWTFHLDIGDDGKLFNMRVTSADGRAENAQFQITPDGQIKLFGKSGLLLDTAGTFKQVIGGDRVYRISGGDRKKVEGSGNHTYDSDYDRSVGENATKNVGNNETTTVGANKTTLVSKQRIDNISGGPTATAKPTDIAYEVNVINGSYDIHVGSPAKTANPLALAGYHIYAYNGAIVLGENMGPPIPSTIFTGLTGVSVSLNTRGLGSVGLGCRLPPFNNPLTEGSNPGLFSGMLYEPWRAWATALITALDAHVHPTAWGPSLPAQYPMGTFGGFNTALGGLVVPIKSLRVVIGA